MAPTFHPGDASPSDLPLICHPAAIGASADLLCSQSLARRMAEFAGLCHGSGLGTLPGFCSKIGGLLPMAPCGRSSLQYLHQSSNFSCASASVGNHWAFRHSARKRPLNASTNALSVSLPGREKSGMANGILRKIRVLCPVRLPRNRPLMNQAGLMISNCSRRSVPASVSRGYGTNRRRQ